MNSSLNPTGIRCVAPSCLAVGEPFSIKIKVLGPIRKIENSGNFCDRKPALRSPFNLNVTRRIQYHDNCLPEWNGCLKLGSDAALSGPQLLEFDGKRQGVFSNDQRPIKTFDGFRITAPGFHFIRLLDEASGMESLSNPIYVTTETPAYRIFWGDPHWQTFFSDGIRCPEELYAFARDEGFLDFGAISDHMEAVTDRQWDYFQAVTNDYNDPGRFATLIGQEWTNHNRAVGAPGHRNIYYRGNGGPPLRSNDPDCDTLTKLWRKLDSLQEIEALAIPHHSANVTMGVDWEQGWNRKYEKAVEIHSVWGSSEKHRDDGNPMPIGALKGEIRGRHVIDALKQGYRFGFVGGGDIHDGRPGDHLHNESYPPKPDISWPSGYTAVMVPALSRQTVFDAMKNRHTYATTQSRIFLQAEFHNDQNPRRLKLKAASEDGIAEAAVVLNGEDVHQILPDNDQRIIECDNLSIPIGCGDFCYVRVTTKNTNMAWSSPYYG